MYHRFFNLAEEPFGVSPDPRFYFESSQHGEAAASILCSISQRRGFSALIASPGLGKTTVIVNLLETLRAQNDVVLLVHPNLAVEALLESILLGLGVSPEAQPSRRTQQLAAHLAVLDRRGRSCVVILDESQNLSPQALESVRMLSNFETPEHKLLQFALVGQPDLGKLLRQPECEQVRQRVNIIARLQPLNPTQVASYIAHRLTVAGGTVNCFSPASLDAINQASAGVPRLINTLCFNALTLAFADSSSVVTEAHVAEAVADLDLDVDPDSRPVSTTSVTPEAVRDQSPGDSPAVELPLPEQSVPRWARRRTIADSEPSPVDAGRFMFPVVANVGLAGLAVIAQSQGPV